MTIQVYYEDRLVGELRGANPEAGEVAYIRETERTIKWGNDAAELPDMIWLSTSKRHCEVEFDRIEKIAGRSNMSVSEVRKVHRIPDYAESMKFMDEHQFKEILRFTWNVLTPTLDQYETLFDSPDFIPL